MMLILKEQKQNTQNTKKQNKNMIPNFLEQQQSNMKKLHLAMVESMANEIKKEVPRRSLSLIPNGPSIARVVRRPMLKEWVL